jgi:hypothetical protein
MGLSEHQVQDGPALRLEPLCPGEYLEGRLGAELLDWVVSLILRGVRWADKSALKANGPERDAAPGSSLFAVVLTWR